MSNSFQAKSFLLGLLCCGPFSPGWTPALEAQSARIAPEARVRITRPVDSGGMLTLAGNTRGEANAQNDRGKLPARTGVPGGAVRRLYQEWRLR